MPGAHVRVMAQQRVVAETTTDRPGGAFMFVRLASARVRVEADHDPEGEVRSAELLVVPGAATELTLVLVPAGVRGVVVDAEDGHPIAGALLSAEDLPWNVPGATSDDAGAFRFALVPFEAAALVAVAPGYKAARVALGAREDQPEPNLRVALRRGDPVDGVVLDPDSRPLAGAKVVACEGQPSEARVDSGEEGAFHLPPSAAGCDAIALHDQMAPSEPVHVDGGPLTLRLGPGGGIEGRAVDDRGRAIDSFSIGVEAFSAPHGMRTDVKPATFQGGAFRLEHLVPGTYVLTASTAGRPPARSDPIDVRSGALTDGVRILLTSGGVLVGRVVDERNAPLTGVDLRFDLVSAVAGSDASAKTDDSGRYRLEGTPRGPFTLKVGREGFRTKLLSGLFVEPGRTITQDVVLTAMDGGAGMELGGIGANIQPAGGGIAFTAVFPGDPADRAGLKAGDRLVRIDGEDIAALSAEDAIQRVRGQPGTTVGVTVQRDGMTLDLVIVRASIVR